MFKTIISAAITAATVLGAYIVFSWLFSEPDYVTSARFEEAHKELTAKIDSVSVKVDSTLVRIGVLDKKVTQIQADINQMKLNQDSLKYGQRIIYNQVKKTNKPWESFFNKIF